MYDQIERRLENFDCRSELAADEVKQPQPEIRREKTIGVIDRRRNADGLLGSRRRPLELAQFRQAPD
jgi:hypothetical protein